HHQAAAGHEPTRPAGRGRITGPVGRVRRGLRTQRTTAQQGRRARPGLCGDHPLRLPDPAALGRGDPRRSGRPGRGVRAPVLRERLQRTPLQRLAMTATAVQGQYLLIRRLLSRPDSHTFYLCWAPPDRPASMTYFITIAGRRWPVEETFKTGKDVFGWDQTQARTWNGTCRHTALAALAQLRALAIRNALTASIALPAASQHPPHTTSTATGDRPASDADLQIPLGDAPVPARGGQPCPPDITPIKLSIAETARLATLAVRYTTGLITRARLAFALRWSRRRRRHQATARWHHYSARLTAVTGPG